MTRKLFFLFLSILTLASCTPDFSDLIPNEGLFTLDQTKAQISITQIQGEKTASVVAEIKNLLTMPVQLSDDQTITVNNQNLAGLDENNQYTRTITAAKEYILTATEPAKFVKTTSIAPPADFQITAPAANAPASLSGFTLTWTNPDPNLKVEFTLRQTIAGIENSKTFGPYTDSGTNTFSADDLAADFVQGKNTPITITVTKIREKAPNGFNSGTLSARLSLSKNVTPAP